MTRDAVLGFRARACGLEARRSRSDLLDAAYPGLEDSSPRSGLLALYARVADVEPEDWRRPGLVQVWGPRGAIHLVREVDRGVFTLGLTPRSSDEVYELRRHARAVLGAVRNLAHGDEIPRTVFRSDSRRKRLAATVSGRVALRWDASETRFVAQDAPEIDVEEARQELARRFLRHLGPATARGFSEWAGVSPIDARATFAALAGETVRVTVEGEERALLESDVLALRTESRVSSVRLLPPGDPLLTAPDRELVVRDGALRSRLWPVSAPPGAVLAHGEIVGTWRRQSGTVSIELAREVEGATMTSIEHEAAGLPLSAGTRVRWVA